MAAELFYGLLPDHLLLVGMLVLMVLDTARCDDRAARLVVAVALLTSLGVLSLQISGGYTADIVPGEVRIDRFALLGKGVIALTGLALAFGFPALRGYRCWMLIAASLLGGMLMLDSAGFATLFLGLEMLSLPGFALMVLGRGDSAASEGAFKYLVLSSVASALVLFGVSLAYGATGTLSIAAWARTLGEPGLGSAAAGLLVLCGLFLKAAVFPFHAWAPDAYAGARLPVTAVLASVGKVAVVLALARVVADAPLDAATVSLVSALAIASIFFGNVAALAQRSFRRMLAYSSIAHAGYMIVALTGTTDSRADDLLVYTLVYALGTLLACASAAVMLPADEDDVGRLDGRFASHPVASLGLAAGVLSLAGLPPFPGFFAKLLVFGSVVASGHLLLAVVAFAGSFLGLAYYVGIVLRLFRTDPHGRTAAPDGPEPVAGEAPA